MADVEFTDVMAREFTVFNDLSGSPFPDSFAREFTIFNDFSGDTFLDGIAREISVFNDPGGDAELLDAVSREFSTFNDFSEDALADGLAREFSVSNDPVGDDLSFVDVVAREFSVQTCTFPLELSSSDSNPAYALAVTGSLSEQISSLNQGPPAFDKSWTVVERRADDHRRTAFRCRAVGVVSSEGAVELIDPPKSCELGSLEDSERIRVFAEQAALLLVRDLKVSFSSPGTYDEGSDLPAGGTVIKTGTYVSSHMVHLDPIGSEQCALSGSVSFDTDIIGVILTNSHLNASDIVLGWPETDYPNGEPGRAPELDRADQVTLTDDRRTLVFEIEEDSGIDQLRIITALSDPMGEPFVDADSFLVYADEVTLDNCQSAFYRFEFNLPNDFASAILEGFANADDEAVVYLNRTAISPLLTQPDCEPNEFDPEDPCYAKQDAGHDRTDGDGRAVLTWPTLDSFGTADVTLFKQGPNELVFAVCGHAAPWKPTGLEFTATISVETCIRLGDLNCDDNVNFSDIDPFVLALVNIEQYGVEYPDCSADAGDMDFNGMVDFGDIDLFVQCVINEGCP